MGREERLNKEDNQANQEKFKEQLGQLVEIANEIIGNTAQQNGIIIPDIKEIHERNKLLVNNKDVISLIEYIGFLNDFLKSLLVERIMMQSMANAKKIEMANVENGENGKNGGNGNGDNQPAENQNSIN